MWPLLGHNSAGALPAAINRRLREDKILKLSPEEKSSLNSSCVSHSHPQSPQKKPVESNRLLRPKLSYNAILFLWAQALSHLKYFYCYQHLAWYAWEENAMYLGKDFVLSLW